jgi:hypothetical protein
MSLVRLRIKKTGASALIELGLRIRVRDFPALRNWRKNMLAGLGNYPMGTAGAFVVFIE